jgi:flagellar hook-associated protein 2
MASGISDSFGLSYLDSTGTFPTAQMVNALLQPQQQRISALQTQKTAVTSQISAMGSLQSKFSALQSAINAMQFQNQVFSRAVTDNTPTGQQAIATATADHTAQTGSFKLTVDQVATTTSRTGTAGISRADFDQTAAFANAGLATTPTAGKLTINGVQIDASAATSVDDVMTAINAASAQTHVTASYVLDGSGNPTGIQISNDGSQPPGTAIHLGSAADTSNFFAATKIATATQVGEDITSTATLGRAHSISPGSRSPLPESRAWLPRACAG